MSKAKPQYPISADREYQRLAEAYMKQLEYAMKRHMPTINRLYRQGLRKDARYDDMNDVIAMIRQEFIRIAAEVEARVSKYRLDKRIKDVSEITRKRNIYDWKRVIRKNFGIDVFEDYYHGETYEKMSKEWVAENVSRIKTIPSETLAEMQEIVLDAFKNGRSIKQVQDEIQKTYSVSSSRARFIARDQIASLNAQITQMQQQDAGVKKYRWSSSKDSRVRDCHRAFDGKIFSWDDPPEGWYMTKRGKKFTGRKCHPGQDICCRCVAIPVFDMDTFSVPVDMKEEKDKR